MASEPAQDDHSAGARGSNANVAEQADKLRTQQQLEALQNKHIGTGHADTTKHDWTSNIMRDSNSSYVGHPPLLHYMALGMGEPVERLRMRFLENMVRPCGPPPKTEE